MQSRESQQKPQEEAKPVSWHAISVTESFSILSAGDRGLASEDAERRLLEHGRNVLPEEPVPGWGMLFLKQFMSPFVYMLLAASFIVYALGQTDDAVIILGVLILNACVGMIQEGRARDTLAALHDFTTSETTVLRDGREEIVSDEIVVPGDILVLREGDKVPADARVISSQGLSADESALTGESTPVGKTAEALADQKLPVAERANMVFKGTLVVAGEGVALVVATGVDTVIGSITKKIVEYDADVPLKEDIAKLSKSITWSVLAACAAVFALGVVRGESVSEMFFVAVAVAVSLIPEGLPIIMTLVLALGVFRMGKRNALVKRLQAVEALGQATVIAVDKTGTITKNELMVSRLYVGGKDFGVTGDGYEPKGGIFLDDKEIVVGNNGELLLAGKVAALCANATVAFEETEKLWKVTGDPTEAALRVFGEKCGFQKEGLDAEAPLVFEIPFDSKHKYHATLHTIGGKLLLAVVGAPELILQAADSYWEHGAARPMTERAREDFRLRIEEMSSKGLRVVGFAINEDAPSEISIDSMPPLTFAGLFGLEDVLREGVREAVETAQRKGVKVVLISGDYRTTVTALAREAGIWKPGDMVVDGADIDRMSALSRSMLTVPTVFARVTPEHKLMIIEAYKKHGDIIAMTGDGVNDALSLVDADLGIAMGRIGTAVAKEAADIILLDDNFSSIIAALEEGRGIYRAIERVLIYLFSTGLGELFVVMGSLIFALPLPLLPSQILWLNVVTDGLPVLALAFEPRMRGDGKPIAKDQNFIDSRSLVRTTIMGVVMAAGTLALFALGAGVDLAHATTIALTALAVYQWFNIYNCRSNDASVTETKIFSNKSLNIAMIITVLLHCAALYAPFMQRILHTVPLSFTDWISVAFVALSVIAAEEIRKLVVRRKRERHAASEPVVSGV